RTLPSRSTAKLADWFTGESEPIPFAIIPSPTKEKLDPVDEMTSSAAVAVPTTQEKPPAKPPMITRFSLFASKQPAPKAPIACADVHDEWHNLEVKTALIPSGAAHPFSPSAYKSLQQNAESLLSKLQAAYKQRSHALHDLLAEKEAQAEEYQGAELRSRHLKLQLDAMTEKLAEQDKAMMDLVDQLAQEKQAHREADHLQPRKHGIKSNEESYNQHTRRSSKSRTSTASEMSLQSEDSGVESLFSRHGATSPTMSMSSVSTMNSPDSTSLHHPSTSADRYQRNTESQCQAAEPKVSNDSTHPSPPFVSTCANCSRLRDSEAWTLVDILKLENTGLKTRLGQLENTVDDCLDMVKDLF
ncbi:MAG: hypothetical protein Q9224_003955, partial [Gallowayella concinna]